MPKAIHSPFSSHHALLRAHYGHEHDGIENIYAAFPTAHEVLHSVKNHYRKIGGDDYKDHNMDKLMNSMYHKDNISIRRGTMSTPLTSTNLAHWHREAIENNIPYHILYHAIKQAENKEELNERPRLKRQHDGHEYYGGGIADITKILMPIPTLIYSGIKKLFKKDDPEPVTVEPKITPQPNASITATALPTEDERQQMDYEEQQQQ